MRLRYAPQMRMDRDEKTVPHLCLLAIVGRSGSGKTTVIERLIPQLRRLGLRVATIKHCHKAIPLDQPGKDSWRHREGGAEATLLISPNGFLLTGVPGDENLAALAERYLTGYDLVLVEGYSGLSGPKIEVARAERSTKLLCAADSELLAVVTDIPALSCNAKRFPLDHCHAALATFILDWLS